jgi:hypothetical protein
MLKRLFCKHEYKYFHQDRYQIFGTIFDKWHYVCCKCGKTTVIREDELSDFVHKSARQRDKEIAMGVDHSKYEDCKVEIGRFTFYRKVAYEVNKKYHNYTHERE